MQVKSPAARACEWHALRAFGPALEVDQCAVIDGQIALF
jgi:recombinational DNA repair protein (RecF pathway)